jgi:hypothetical protein
MRQAITATKPATEVINDIAGKPMIDNPTPKREVKNARIRQFYQQWRFRAGPHNSNFTAPKQAAEGVKTHAAKTAVARKQNCAANAAQGEMPVSQDCEAGGLGRFRSWCIGWR